MSVDGDTRVMPIVPPAAAAGKRVDRGRRAGDRVRTVSVAHHPRVAARVRAAKGWGALGAFALVALVSSRAGATAFDVLFRALIAGVIGWVVAWTAAVQVGRAVVRAEVEAHVRAIEARAGEQLDAVDDGF